MGIVEVLFRAALVGGLVIASIAVALLVWACIPAHAVRRVEEDRVRAQGSDPPP